MKNIVTITLAVLVLLLAGVLVKNYSTPTEEKLPSFLPAAMTTTQELTLFQSNPVPSSKTVKIGPSAEEEEEFNVISTQGQYLSEDRKLALTISIEEIDSDDYDLYKEKVWERYTAPSRGGEAKQEVIRDHDVYLSFRTISEEDDTSQMVVMGGGYVFFPEENIAVTYSLYNPRLSACDDIWDPATCTFDENKELPTMDDARSIATQILQQYLGDESTS